LQPFSEAIIEPDFASALYPRGRFWHDARAVAKFKNFAAKLENRKDWAFLLRKLAA
jgi:hypothetical protein